ncbi:MAG: RNA polymerase factor sigma-54 [Muribaculaceae bacterium]|nr:RNA polymerase factor sigma-54 [Muribaculaceae bacterium]
MEDTSLRLTQEQKLQQRLSPQQVMFGRLLEMSAPEVEDEVRREVDDNPALEVVDHDEMQATAENDFGESAEELQRADYGSSEEVPFYDQQPRGIRRQASADFDPMSIVEADAPDEGSLNAAMNVRLSELDLNSEERLIAEYIIGNLDDNGYLPRTLSAIAADIAAAEGRDPDISKVREVFAKIRTLEPAGIGAVDLRDCLLLQLDRMERSLPQRVAREIIAENFDLFSKKHFDRLAGRLGVDKATIEQALVLIRTLNPKPGAMLGGSSAADRASHIIPDFAVERHGVDGPFTVMQLNRTPELAIERSFIPDPASVSETRGKGAAERRLQEAQAFIKRKHDDAALFIKMLADRGRTLQAVMEAIVGRQEAFFTSGQMTDLRPMILKDISGDTGLDISTISRATSGKYVLTPHGTFPLKLFFNERPKAEADTSTHEILEALRGIIDGEDKRHPLSDEALKDALVTRGYDIARRTVAKYRERLGIPVGRLRKSFETMSTDTNNSN